MLISRSAARTSRRPESMVALRPVAASMGAMVCRARRIGETHRDHSPSSRPVSFRRAGSPSASRRPTSSRGFPGKAVSSACMTLATVRPWRTRMSLTAPSLPGPQCAGLRRRCDPRRPALPDWFRVRPVSSRGRAPPDASWLPGYDPHVWGSWILTPLYPDGTVRKHSWPSLLSGPAPVPRSDPDSPRCWSMASARTGASHGRCRR